MEIVIVVSEKSALSNEVSMEAFLEEVVLQN